MASSHSHSTTATHTGQLHEKILDSLGSAIISGHLTPEDTLTIDSLERQYGVSRSVVRDCLRALQTMNLVESKRRVGITPQHRTNWNVYEPRIIRWRLASSDRANQLRSLTQLRAAVEPEAARLAAENITPESADTIRSIAGEMWAAGKSANTALFLERDIEFHRFILNLSKNEMFSHLHAVIEEVLTGRTTHGLMSARPHQDALQQHLDVAEAIASGDGEESAAAMQRLMRRTLDEMMERIPTTQLS
ncbi:FCD domain-containing protein [Lysinibacter sp. HNR]|uniref:FadR/GntR family transcriptional regulator n=1 Tax=Lysinibacter sp. HNR TaxID=3031408 RepID=UPI0024347D25|nr:FCD domain-containing protein [Lysinibacter sp. HNR]WGD38176.1 FCD domain-containing protein [Lysinibacter sp. HNR]